jgi:hypothetical protein
MPYTSNQKYRSLGRRSKGAEMFKYIVGPMPAQEFLDTFFPVEKLFNLDTIPQFEPGCYTETIDNQFEVNAYNPFVSEQFW